MDAGGWVEVEVEVVVERCRGTPQSYGDWISALFKFKAVFPARSKDYPNEVHHNRCHSVHTHTHTLIHHLHKAIKDGNTDATTDVYKTVSPGSNIFLQAANNNIFYFIFTAFQHRPCAIGFKQFLCS